MKILIIEIENFFLKTDVRRKRLLSEPLGQAQLFRHVTRHHKTLLADSKQQIVRDCKRSTARVAIRCGALLLDHVRRELRSSDQTLRRGFARTSKGRLFRLLNGRSRSQRR